MEKDLPFTGRSFLCTIKDIMTSSDIIEYKKKGYDPQRYKKAQEEKIRERISMFTKGRLYLEIGGKFLYDPHATRVLPGFNPTVKVEMFRELGVEFDVIFCVNAEDIVEDRLLSTDSTTYIEYTDKMLKDYESALSIKPYISLNLIQENNSIKAQEYVTRMEGLGYKVYRRYHIEGYPDSKEIVSEKGYGKDEYIPGLKNLVLVVGAASNSGKMSTCLGQIYHDHLKGEESGYAKYETFPIWNLPINHPINLAYESATVDIGDYNMLDKYHLYNYNIMSVNYNRDVAAFKIVEKLIKEIVSKDNFITTYKSPTDMGVNMAYEGIIDDEIVSIAGYNEIIRRKDWYFELRGVKPKAEKWSNRCDELALKALKYIENKKYRLDLDLTN